MRMKFIFLVLAMTIFSLRPADAQDTKPDNGEGQTKAEFIEYAKDKLGDQGEKFLERFAAAVDKDNDGRISESEFAGRMEALRQMRREQDSADKESKDKKGKSDYEKNSRRAAPKDAFPVFDDPAMASAADSDLSDDEPVIGVEINGQAKAYPISIMGRHELGNDVCGETPITVSW